MGEELKPFYDIRVNKARREVRIRMSGIMDLETIQAMQQESNQVTDALDGPHVVLADMRGLRTMPNDVAQVMGEIMVYGRRRGTKLCAHVSDITVQRLQAARLARQFSPDDEITVDCHSVEEAEKVCREASAKLAGLGSEPLRSHISPV